MGRVFGESGYLFLNQPVPFESQSGFEHRMFISSDRRTIYSRSRLDGTAFGLT